MSDLAERLAHTCGGIYNAFESQQFITVPTAAPPTAEGAAVKR